MIHVDSWSYQNHRLFAHRAYPGYGALRLFYLLFGAGSFQGPALRWASDHRNHHARPGGEDSLVHVRHTKNQEMTQLFGVAPDWVASGRGLSQSSGTAHGTG